MTTANKITLARIFLIPVFMIFFSIDSLWSNLAALAVFMVAAATDGIDGYVARKYNQVSDLGKFLDPLADKLLVTAALVGLVGMGKISAWMVVVILAREFMVTSLRTIAANNGRVIAASLWGKVKTVIQIIAVIVLIISDYPALNFGCACAMTAVTILSGIDYMVKNRDVLSGKAEKDE